MSQEQPIEVAVWSDVVCPFCNVARDRVAAATTRRELEWMVRRHELRLTGFAIATRGLERARDLIAQAVPARR